MRRSGPEAVQRVTLSVLTRVTSAPIPPQRGRQSAPGAGARCWGRVGSVDAAGPPAPRDAGLGPGLPRERVAPNGINFGAGAHQL